jgi:hypothetical protein
MHFNSCTRLFSFAAVLVSASSLAAQVATPPEAQLPAGTVVSDAPTERPVPQDTLPANGVTDAERSAVDIQSLSLDLHLLPVAAREEGHATLTLRNRGDGPLARVPLQLSSTLHWLAISIPSATGLAAIPFTQSPVASDADHTGYVQEAVLTLPAALAPGASLTVSVFYAGEIKPSADRLELIGTAHDRATAADWDAIAPTSDAVSTALRGFGNVVWYPTAAPLALLGNGNQLFHLIADERRHNLGVMMRLRVTVDYIGDPPVAAIFNGQLQALAQVPDGTDLAIAETHGIASAEFPLARIGFRSPSLFLTAQPAVTSADQMLSIISPQGFDERNPYALAAASLQPLLAGLMGAGPRTPLLLLDHAGEPFEDGAFLAARLTAAADPGAASLALVRGLTHAWFADPTKPPAGNSVWIAEGLPEFVSLLAAERSGGREAALGQTRHAAVLLALAEAGAEERLPLTAASADVLLRLKSALVFWQLRDILGDEAFSRGITAYRRSLNSGVLLDEKSLQRDFETASKSELAWFFDDWVYRDRGLPELTIVSANPRPLPATSARLGGSLVAVEVRNDGDAVADVPVTVRAGNVSATERLRIAGHSSASVRIVFGGTPETVEVNDGSVPESGPTTHTVTFVAPTSPS